SSVFVVSDASGIPNLERVDTATRTAVPLTHVTGAALAPAPDWVHGSIYFLRLHARGLDLAMTSDTRSTSRPPKRPRASSRPLACLSQLVTRSRSSPWRRTRRMDSALAAIACFPRL